MAKADFDIQFLDGESSDTTTLYHPGEVLRGQVTIFTDSNMDCKNILARLVWHTEGRGTPYQEIITEKELFQGTLKAGLPNYYEFAFDLPQDPWSYEGHYVSVVWAVEIDIDVPWGKDIKESKPFLLRPLLTKQESF
ncbi:MAG: hypothetical protein IAF02_11535 [Anaerolineae bacterium]|nr:hypothetical protein [Anaerolineae bacterium]